MAIKDLLLIHQTQTRLRLLLKEIFLVLKHQQHRKKVYLSLVAQQYLLRPHRTCLEAVEHKTRIKHHHLEFNRSFPSLFNNNPNNSRQHKALPLVKHLRVRLYLGLQTRHSLKITTHRAESLVRLSQSRTINTIMVRKEYTLDLIQTRSISLRTPMLLGHQFNHLENHYLEVE